MFYNIRHSLGKRSLYNKSRRMTRKKTVHNFMTAKTVCIIFEGSTFSDFKYIKEFRKFLKSAKIKSFLLGYVDKDEIPGEMILLDNAIVFCRKDIDIFFRPGKNIQKAFLGKKFINIFRFNI